MADEKMTYEELLKENQALKEELRGLPRPAFGDNVKRYPLGEIKDKLLRHGRMPKRDEAILWHTASGIEFSVKAKEVWIELDAEMTGNGEYIRVTVNGYEAVRTPVHSGVTKICAYRGLPDTDVSTVRIYKDAQPFTYALTKLAVTAIWTNGEFVEPPKRKWRFEFIGDSITSGEGLGGPTMAWIPFTFSCRGSYALRVGEALDADVSIMAFSGNGIACNGHNDPRTTLPKRYGYVVGKNEKGEGAGEEYDPAENGTDAVIVNLGTNDMGATGRPPFVDPETGEETHMTRGEDGLLIPKARKFLLDAAIGFMTDLRAKNPKLRAIVMIYGMMGARQELADIYTEAAEIAGGGITTVLRVPTMSRDIPGSVGARNHPGPQNHAAVADVLVEHLRSLGF